MSGDAEIFRSLSGRQLGLIAACRSMPEFRRLATSGRRHSARKQPVARKVSQTPHAGVRTLVGVRQVVAVESTKFDRQSVPAWRLRRAQRLRELPVAGAPP